MNNQFKKWLIWIPRILTIVLIGFLAIFALDAFGEYDNWREILAALSIHLIPNLILLIALLIAWHWKLIGGAIFLILAVLSTVFFNATEYPVTFFVVSLPLYVIGILFILDAFSGTFDPQKSQR